MKKNTQKILLALYSFDSNHQIVLPLETIGSVLPDISDGGFRSLILFLERKGWVIKESLPGSQVISLTHKGREALKAKFPALNESWSTWNGEWQALVCIKAPESDQQFRYLRQLLISQHALALSRGVYLAAGAFSQEVMGTCKLLYHDAVVIFSVGDWQFGLDRPIITKYYDLASVATMYSSISETVGQLLTKINISKKRTDQQKAYISTVIDRLCDCLKEDPGFTTHYFPGLPDIRSLLPQIQQLMKL